MLCGALAGKPKTWWRNPKRANPSRAKDETTPKEKPARSHGIPEEPQWIGQAKVQLNCCRADQPVTKSDNDNKPMKLEMKKNMQIDLMGFQLTN